MAVAFDAFSESTPGTGNQTCTHNPVGTVRGVIVFCMTLGNTDEVSTCTYGGAAMTEVTGSPLIKTTGEAMTISAWFLGSSIPTDDPATVTVTATASTLTKKAFCITYTADTDTETVDVDATISSDAIDDPSVTLSLGGRTCAAAIGFLSGKDGLADIAPLTNWTEQDETDGGAIVLGVYTYDIVGTTDVTAGWTQDNSPSSEDAVAIAVAVSEAAGGAAPFRRQTTRRLLLGIG